MNIVILDSKDVDIERVLEFLINRKRDLDKTEPSLNFRNQTRDYLEWAFGVFISKNCVAYKGQELYGWLALTHILPATVILHEWHPLIKPCVSETQIALDLLKESYSYAHSKEIKNIRVFIDVLESKRNRFHEVQEVYQQAKLKQTHLALCMENYSLSKNDLKNILFPSYFQKEPMLDQDMEIVLKCHEFVFENTVDKFIASLDAEERSSWNFFDRTTLNGASTVVKHKNEIIAFIAASDHGDYIELGPIGVIKDYRRQNLGKLLMEQCLSSLIQQNRTNCYLEVSEGNIPAYNLYKEYGFTVVSQKHGFLHRA
ncbi:MAG: GNAT family N-acetyltransferase [Candidatus Hodarchaeales archaeon]|jgi:ribosomal protein S18 acetylase RimI-like enzyme